MKTIYHAANSRGHANHGWLDSHHTFSFANYYDPERMHFGQLRVLNDDVVLGGKGFGTHPHRDMEIISIPITGDLAHKDSMGHTQVIRQGDVQIMSAGTGVLHSEFNHSETEPVNFLQIWVMPKELGIEPRYEQQIFPQSERKNRFQTVVSPQQGNGLWINQDAYFSLGHFDKDQTVTYPLKSADHGVYLFVISGQVQVGEHKLSARDGLGVWETKEISLTTLEESEILLIEVPLI